MKKLLCICLLLAGCSHTTRVKNNPPMRPGGPDWEEVDKTVQRIREREHHHSRLVETERSQEQGFLPMSNEDYTAILDAARADIRKSQPDLSTREIEQEAVRRADEEKRRYETTLRSKVSSSYEWK